MGDEFMSIVTAAKWISAVVAGLAALFVVVKVTAIGIDIYAVGPAAHAEVSAHHDSLEAAYDVLGEVQMHLEHDDSTRAEQKRQLDYLICTSIERKRERDGWPPLRDCDAELLAGEIR